MLAGMNREKAERLRRWERRTGSWLVVLAVLFLVAYTVPILWPQFPRLWQWMCATTNWVIWAVFIGDYLVRVGLSDDRWGFVRRHPLDLAVLVLPMLRPLRLLMLIKVLLVVERRTEIWARGRYAVYVGGTMILLVLIASLAMLDAERGAEGASIETFWDALWWSAVTVTTVGYGDTFPVTAAGRVIAAAMMLCGIGLLGFVTASLATWVLEKVSIVTATGQQTRAEVGDVLWEVRQLRAELAALRATVPGQRPGQTRADAPDPSG